MDTRQLAAFCAVVERRSFSQAAERLGVTQPAVSLQIRALEKRLGTKLLDRSGRRVEPTEAGMRLYRGAQRLLALEEQVVAEVAEEGERASSSGRFEIGASTGPGRDRALAPALRVRRAPPAAARRALGLRHAARSSSGSRRRELELGVVGAARRHRGVVVRAVLPRRGGPRLPAGPRVRRDERSRSTSCAGAGLIVMQEGAGVRQLIEDELHAAGTRLRDLDVRLELGLQESVTSAVRAGYGVTFISRSSVESDLAAGTLAEARVEGLELEREISLVRAAGPRRDARRPGVRRLRAASGCA